MSEFNDIEHQEINEAFEQVLNVYLSSNPQGNETLVREAFHFANQAHMGMRRKSGEPYIFHPIAVAMIIAKEIGLGATSIACAFLHDVVEDTEYTVEDIEGTFNAKIGGIVDGLTKLKGATTISTDSLQAEYFKKLLLTMSEDIRVILIKIADRLHNMRTLEVMAAHKQYKIASETLFIYAPLSHRLGLHLIKKELEDLSFKFDHPETYKIIEGKIEATEKARAAFFDKFSQPIKERMKLLDFDFAITERVKSVYSIWQKMQVKKVPFEEIYDIFAIRVVFEPKLYMNEKTQCWNIYSAITDIYTPKPDRIRDWLSSPKANGYEALHGTVMGPKGKWVEIQIRSARMNEVAEKGYAAHWKYKGGHELNETALERWLKNVREVLESPDSDAVEFLDDFKANLFSNEIMVFTPKGQMKIMAQESTALDFAFEIHSEVGYHCIGAKVNHKTVPLSYKLKSGDQVEILTSPKAKPAEDWIDYVTSGKAKSKIKDLFKADRKKFMRIGEKSIQEELSKLKLTLNTRILKKLLAHFDIQKRDELFFKIGKEIITLEDLPKILKEKTPNKLVKYWTLQFWGTNKKTGTEKKKNNKKDVKVRITDDSEDISYHIAHCCHPIPGDDVVGFRNEDNSIDLHKRDCSEAIKLMSSYGGSIVEAEWATHKLMSFLSVIKINGIDRMGMLSNIANLISNEHAVNMRTVQFETFDGIFEGVIHLYVPNTEELNNLILKLLKIKGINSVLRIENKDTKSKNKK